ncbi:hypothetical protein ZWY2020_009214 [Hordeum vulgare]|nr:hypothetical protein ZWY2020_009214 [Hordeum vulgare]
MKNVRPPSKKTKGKGKSAVAEPSEVDESQVGDALSENSPPTSGDSVMSTLPPMIRVPGAQAKKRKTSGSTPVATSEPIKESTPIQDNPDQAEPENQMDLPESPKETMDTPKPPSPLTTTEDRDVVETLAQTESALGDLKKNLSGQQDARAKSEEKYQLALAELEKLKAELKRAQADQDAAIKRAEKAEARLATVQQELSGLKHHISNMTQAVFGPRAANLQEDCVLMLKAIYTLTEQLYTGSVLTVKAVMGAKEPITSIKKVLGCLSTLPPQIGELTRSAARKGVRSPKSLLGVCSRDQPGRGSSRLSSA